MNSAVFTKIEYRFPGDNSFTEFEIVPESGKLYQESKRGRFGLAFDTRFDFKIAGIDETKDADLKLINNRKIELQLTDSNGKVYSIGTSTYPARILIDADHGQSPSSFNGYVCKVTCVSPQGYSVE